MCATGTLGTHTQQGLQYLVCVCVCVCSYLSVCLLVDISPLEHLFVLKTLSHIQQATKVKKFVGISLKMFCFYGVICISRQHVRPYLMFVATEASLLVRKDNDILNTTRNTSQ